MKPHKHAELIKAWADGAEIEVKDESGNWVYSLKPLWFEEREYRIKPQAKPDVVIPYFINKQGSIRNPSRNDANILLTFDGETGELKSAEVL